MPRPFLCVPALALWLLCGTAHAAPHPQLQAYFQTTLTDAGYQKKVMAKVSGNWRPPHKAPPKSPGKAVVQTVIGHDGKLVSATLTMESGMKAWDDALMSAVKKSAPFPPLPASFTYDTLQVHFHASWVR